MLLYPSLPQVKFVIPCVTQKINFIRASIKYLYFESVKPLLHDMFFTFDLSSLQDTCNSERLSKQTYISIASDIQASHRIGTKVKIDTFFNSYRCFSFYFLIKKNKNFLRIRFSREGKNVSIFSFERIWFL